MAKNIYKLKADDKATFYSSVKVKAPALGSKNTEECMFVVDSGASMHMLSKKDLSSDEMSSLRRSRNPTTVMTADGEVQTNEEAQAFVHDLDLFIRSSDNSKDKPACGEPMLTDPDKPATGNRESAHTKDEMHKEDPTQGIPEWLQPFTDNLDLLETHVPAHSSERGNPDSESVTKVVTHKKGSTVFILTSPKTEIATYA